MGLPPFSMSRYELYKPTTDTTPRAIRSSKNCFDWLELSRLGAPRVLAMHLTTLIPKLPALKSNETP